MDFFNMFNQKPDSKEVAKERLKLILIHDRASVSPELLENIKEDIMNVISKYVQIDKEGLEIKMTNPEQTGEDTPALVASIPIIKMKKRK